MSDHYKARIRELVSQRRDQMLTAFDRPVCHTNSAGMKILAPILCNAQDTNDNGLLFTVNK